MLTAKLIQTEIKTSKRMESVTLVGPDQVSLDHRFFWTNSSRTAQVARNAHATPQPGCRRSSALRSRTYRLRRTARRHLHAPARCECGRCRLARGRADRAAH